MNIRQERPEDRDAVYQVVKAAFQSAEHSDGTEQDLVNALRHSPSFLPELSLMAVEGEKIVGHILFTKAQVGAAPVLALAPLSVLPGYQRRGIGLALMERGHRIARSLGYRYSVVLGHPGYYPKAGYVPAGTYGIQAPFPVEDETFMALCLSGDPVPLDGIMEYDKAFGI